MDSVFIKLIYIDLARWNVFRNSTKPASNGVNLVDSLRYVSSRAILLLHQYFWYTKCNVQLWHPLPPPSGTPHPSHPDTQELSHITRCLSSLPSKLSRTIPRDEHNRHLSSPSFVHQFGLVLMTCPDQSLLTDWCDFHFANINCVYTLFSHIYSNRVKILFFPVPSDMSWY